MAWHTMSGFRHDPAAVRGKRVERETMRRVLTFAAPYRRQLIGFVVTAVLAAAVGAIPPLLFRSLLDHGLPSEGNAGNLTLITWLTIAAVIVALGTATLGLLQRFYSALIGEGLIYDLRVAVFDHVQRLPLGFFTRTQTGALMSRMNNDVIGAQQAVTNTLGSVITNVIALAVTLTVMLALEWRLTLLTLLVLPAFIIPARRIGTKLQKATREQMQVNASMNTTANERFNVAGALLVKLFGRYDDERTAFGQRAGRVRDIGVSTAMYQRVLFVALGFVAAVGTAVVYYIGGRLAISGVISAGTVGAFVLYVSQIYQPLTMLTNARVDVLTAMVSFERVFEVLDFEPLIQDDPTAISLQVEDDGGSIEFDHVWFRHPAPGLISLPSLEEGSVEFDEPSDWILRDVSFRIAPGEFVAIVGPSGAGKTTISMLVPRIVDAVEGAVRIDGHDVRSLSAASLTANLGVVMQEPHLFHESVRENLRYGRPDATNEEIEAACRAARIHDLIAVLPDGYDTIVGDRGYRLSGGEKQRLAIARMLLKNPRIVILDEATSHLDSESEAAIQGALAATLVGRTAIVIAHRLSTVVEADRILVVDRGEIVESGTHRELMTRSGLYAELYRTQHDRGDTPELDAVG